MEKNLVYSLSCPITKEVHYVGKSSQGLLRPLQHLSQSHSQKINEWVTDLNVLGYSPTISVLEYIFDTDLLSERESFWIKYHVNKGCLLLNIQGITVKDISIDGGSDFTEYLDAGYMASQVRIGRKKLGLSQEEFADKCNIALTVIRKIEQGKSNYNHSALLTVLGVLGSTLRVVPITSISTD